MRIRSFRWLLLSVLILAVLPAIGAEKLAKATFAGGCFWCMEPPFEKLPGVVAVTSGFSGGQTKNPTYEEVSSGGTGHAESVQVLYDPAKVSYAQLLQTYWHNVDPTQVNGQFCDHGDQYRTAIFYGTAQEKDLAEKSKVEVEKQLKHAVVTQIVPAAQFYAAEEYHQDFYKKNPARYSTYRLGCGRDRRLKELWGDAAGSH